jgi:hypothetical protein
MRNNWKGYLLAATLLAGTTLSGTAAVYGQDPPPPGPGPEAMMEGGPGGPGGPLGRMEILGFGEMHSGKVVTGAPYSAVAVTESTQTLSDGNTINRKVQSNVFRDSQGRTRRETTLPGVGPLAASGQPKSFVMIHDPVASTAYVLHPDTKVAEQLPAHNHGPKANAEGADVQDRFQAHMEKEIANGTLKKEDLGTQVINGISATGTRFTRTIPVGQIGNNKAIVITSERWYSTDMQVVVKSVHTDPRQGSTTYMLTNVQKTEPAATLFAVPADYTVEQGGPRNRMRRGAGGPGGPEAGPGTAAPTNQ